MINKLKILQFSIFSSQAVIMEIQCFHLTHSVLACGFVNDSPALLRVLSLSASWTGTVLSPGPGGGGLSIRLRGG